MNFIQRYLLGPDSQVYNKLQTTSLTAFSFMQKLKYFSYMNTKARELHQATPHITPLTGIRHTSAAGNMMLHAGLFRAIKYIPQQFASASVRDYCPYPS